VTGSSQSRRFASAEFDVYDAYFLAHFIARNPIETGVGRRGTETRNEKQHDRSEENAEVSAIDRNIGRIPLKFRKHRSHPPEC